MDGSWKPGLITGPVKFFTRLVNSKPGWKRLRCATRKRSIANARLSCVAQSILQRAACSAQQSEKFKFADTQQTIGQKLYTLQREALHQVIQFVHDLFQQGQHWEQVLHQLMPA